MAFLFIFIQESFIFFINAKFYFRFASFFDNHDLWHFFSSVALFFAFLGLLTIDDDILDRRQTHIKVF